MKSNHNPWAARFKPLLDREALKLRATTTVPKLVGLPEMHTELACKSLYDALKAVFYPTEQCLNVLHRLVGAAHAHCITLYPDSKTFLAGVYSKNATLPAFSPPICLTGLGGTGKTEIMKTFSRIQQDETEIKVDDIHSPFPLRGSWSATVQARSSPKDVLKSLAQSDGILAELVNKCRKLAYRDGIPFLVADEFQFATGSDKANAQVTQMLLSLGYIGLPFLFVANFSLITRLKKRPQEEQQRLLSDVIVLTSDSPESDDWCNTLEALQAVAPDILIFDSKKDAAALHTYSAGIKRAMVRLIVEAYRIEHPRGGKVDLAAIKHAYDSIGYAGYREEIGILATQAVQSKADRNRKDLWCPLPLPSNVSAVFFEHAKKERDERVAKAELESSLTSEERQALKTIQKESNKTKNKSGKVLPIRKKSAPTADDLKQNANWYKDQL